jgi:hypothetical protein
MLALILLLLVLAGAAGGWFIGVVAGADLRLCFWSGPNSDLSRTDSHRVSSRLPGVLLDTPSRVAHQPAHSPHRGAPRLERGTLN